MFTFIYSAEGRALGLLWSLNSVQLRLNLSICKMKRAVLCCFGIVCSLVICLCIVLIFAGALKNGSDNELPGVLFCDSILLWNLLLCGLRVFGCMALSWPREVGFLLFASLTFMMEMQGSSVTPLLLVVFLFVVINLGFMRMV